MDDFSTKLFIRFILAIIALVIAYNFLAPMLQYLVKRLMFKDKGNSVDIETLIRRQKLMMRSGTDEVKTEQVDEKVKSQTLLRYQDAFVKDSSNQEFKAILKIFDDLQWGEGDFLKEQTKFLQKNYKIDVSNSSLTRQLRELIDRDYFISLHSQELATIKQIKLLLRIKCLFETMLHQTHLRRGDVFELLAKKYNTTSLNFMLAFELFLLTKAGKKRGQSFNAIVSKSAKEHSILPQNFKNIFNKIIFKENRSDFYTPEEFTDLIALELKGIEFISPLPALKNKNDFETAFKILRVNKNCTIEHLKKQYKMLANLKHPDKISSHGIDKKFEALASENFARLKEAYDIILKSKKESS